MEQKLEIEELKYGKLFEVYLANTVYEGDRRLAQGVAEKSCEIGGRQGLKVGY